MKRILINILLMPILVLLPAITFAEPVYADCGKTSAAKQVSVGIDETTTSNCDDNGVTRAITVAVRILSIAAGAAAVIAIIFSGFKYITSGGEASKVANAKNSLIYALIGIAIAVLAQLLVRVVITESNKAAIPACSTHPHLSPPDCSK